MIRTSNWIVCWLAVLTLPVALFAQEAQEPESPEKDEAEVPLIIKVYQVLDLVTRAPDYPYAGSYLPAFHDGPGVFFPGQTPTVGGGVMTGGGMMGGTGMGGMGGGGMGGGGMGGGMFQIPAETFQAQRAGQNGRVGGMAGMAAPAVGVRRGTMAQLIDGIEATVAPTTWDEVGGPGAITVIGDALAILQTTAVHEGVKDLLDQLRRGNGTMHSLTIDAQWLALSKEQLAALKTPADAKKPAALGQSVNRQALAKLPETTRRYAGEITCFNGQTVHIVSGRLETAVQGGIPVVGGGTPAFQAKVFTPQIGALLQVTAVAISGDERVLLDLRSCVTRADESPKPVELQSPGSDATMVRIDRLNVATQQFATSVRLPLGEPALVGGMTFPGREPGSSEQLYLIIEIRPAN